MNSTCRKALLATNVTFELGRRGIFVAVWHFSGSYLDLKPTLVEGWIFEIVVEKMLLFDDNKVNIARKPGKKRMVNPVGCTGEGKR